VRDGLQDVVAHGGQLGLELAAGHVGAADQQHVRLVLQDEVADALRVALLRVASGA